MKDTIPDRKKPELNETMVIEPATSAPRDQAHRPTSVSLASFIQRIRKSLCSPRVWLLAVAHALLFTFVYWLAFLLRFDFAIPQAELRLFAHTAAWLIGIKLIIFYFAGHFEGWWRYVTFADLLALMRAAILSLLVLATVDHFAELYQIPRSILLLDAALSIVVLGALRASWRLAREQYHALFESHKGRAALMVGTDDSSAMLACQMQSHPKSQYRICGFLEINGTAHTGRRIGQIQVRGHVNDVAKVAAVHGVEDILMVAGTLPGDRLRQLMRECAASQLKLKIIPRVEDIFSGGKHVPIRDIEISDLLRRDPVQLDTTAIKQLVTGRTIMVTGAGGSIGSEICRQVLKFNPAVLLLVGRGENRIFAIENELKRSAENVNIKAVIADVTDQKRMRHLFETHHPNTIFHAAAHKHVPLMEANAGEAVRNNICGTRCVADLANEYEADSFVLISTDKAVHPTSIMGVTKHIAERYVHTLSQDSSTRFMVTRFGNVLGSNGSVVPLFQEQIRRGGPITVTDPRMTRFFMTIPEASQLVLQAAAMGRGGEIYVLEMGKPVRIVDLARDLIRLSGLPEDAIEITYSGIRPGEKLYEELYFEDEETLPTAHPKLRAAYHRPYSPEEIRYQLAELEQVCYASGETVREKLHDFVPEYYTGTLGQAADEKPKTIAEPVLTVTAKSRTA